jgi:hypothetical protein
MGTVKWGAAGCWRARSSRLMPRTTGGPARLVISYATWQNPSKSGISQRGGGLTVLDEVEQGQQELASFAISAASLAGSVAERLRGRSTIW